VKLVFNCPTSARARRSWPEDQIPVSFQRLTLREEVPDANLFHSIDQVSVLTELWIPEYNEKQAHDSLTCLQTGYGGIPASAIPSYG
jgi:Integrase core domain